MKIFSIADLHLCFHENIDKPMDVFGGQWTNYTDRLKDNWNEIVGIDDIVLIPGDVSWAVRKDELRADLSWIEDLKGVKVISKGNHDYWWKSGMKLQGEYKKIYFINNNYYKINDDYAVCGSRGWILPNFENFTKHDEKIYKREIMRLRNSLESARKDGFENIIGMIHYPPILKNAEETEFSRIFKEYDVKNVVYGHLHGVENFEKGFQGEFNGINYKLVSLDYLKCKPLEIKI